MFRYFRFATLVQRPAARPDIFPHGYIVAAFALAPEGAVMNVVLVMATAAGGRQIYFLVCRLLVAIVTTGFLVPVFQLEAGLVVIEIPDLPIARVVAALALRPQAAFVDILFFVARPAIRFCILERRRSVALLAFGLDMLAG